MNVDDWIADHDAMYPVDADGHRYVAVCYTHDHETTADLVPRPIFRTFAQPALARADAPRYVDAHALKETADGYGYSEAVDRWIDAGVVPDHHPPDPPWDRLLQYAGYWEPHDPQEHH